MQTRMTNTCLCLCVPGSVPDMVKEFEFSPLTQDPGWEFFSGQYCKKPSPFEFAYCVNCWPSLRGQVLETIKITSSTTLSGPSALIFFLCSHQVFIRESSAPIHVSPDRPSHQHLQQFAVHLEMLFSVWVDHATHGKTKGLVKPSFQRVGHRWRIAVVTSSVPQFPVLLLVQALTWSGVWSGHMIRVDWWNGHISS